MRRNFKTFGANLHCVILAISEEAIFSFLTYSLSRMISLGSLGARINELKQRVIAENPHRYGIAVPRESVFTDQHHTLLEKFKNSSVILLYKLQYFKMNMQKPHFVLSDRHHSTQEEP